MLLQLGVCPSVARCSSVAPKIAPMLAPEIRARISRAAESSSDAVTVGSPSATIAARVSTSRFCIEVVSVAISARCSSVSSSNLQQHIERLAGLRLPELEALERCHCWSLDTLKKKARSLAYLISIEGRTGEPDPHRIS